MEQKVVLITGATHFTMPRTNSAQIARYTNALVMPFIAEKAFLIISANCILSLPFAQVVGVMYTTPP